MAEAVSLVQWSDVCVALRSIPDVSPKARDGKQPQSVGANNNTDERDGCFVSNSVSNSDSEVYIFFV